MLMFLLTLLSRLWRGHRYNKGLTYIMCCRGEFYEIIFNVVGRVFSVCCVR